MGGAEINQRIAEAFHTRIGLLMTFGKYPDVTLALARDRRSKARGMLATSVDPMAHRKTGEDGPAGGQRKLLCERRHEMAGALAARLEPSSCRLDQTPSECQHSAQSGRARPMPEIEAPEIVTMVRLMDARNARDIAKRALQTTGQIFRYGIAHGYAKRNPATEIQPRDILKASQRVNFARIDAKELPDLLRKLETYPGKHRTRLAIKLIVLTFVRTGELIGAKWSEFDMDDARWDIPAERMKMKTPHIVPLSRQSLEILLTLRDLTEWVFPGERGGERTISNNTILKGLERMGYKRRMTGHGFRGLASTILHERDYPHEHIELQLTHAPRNAVSAAYNHAIYLKPRTKMMQDWADFLEQAQRGTKILKFREARA